MVRDRWRWLRARLPRTNNGETLIDVGCGTGAFTICAALRGYRATGLTWDESDQQAALGKAAIIGVSAIRFDICDVRNLAAKTEYLNKFDVAICCENIEHILDDKRLVHAIYGTLRPGGRLYLTTPNYYFRAVTNTDNGPYSKVEDGGHVRRGYSRGSLSELFSGSGFVIEEITYCSGFLSQRITTLLRQFRGDTYVVGWLLTLPLRLLIPPLDRLLGSVLSFPPASICIEVYKPRQG